MEKNELELLCSNVLISIRSFLNRSQNESIESLILGVSGGMDSTLVAALVSQVIKDTNIKLRGYCIPIHTNKEDEIKRACAVGAAFCNTFSLVRMTDAYFPFAEAILGKEVGSSLVEGKPLSLTDRIRAGNVKARMRMIYLYDQARLHNGLVLSTDNLTEFLLGFWTLHGDVGDFGCIQNLWKSEVYELSQYLAEHYYGMSIKSAALLECILATPTDGLGVSASDMEQLIPDWEELVNPMLEKSAGWQAYEVIDKLLQEWLAGANLYRYSDLKEHPVIKRMYATEFKRKNPYNIPRTDLL